MARFKNIPARVALVYTDWAKVYMQNKKYAEAREKLLMALRHHITNANALRHLAYCLSFEPCKDVETEESIYWQLVNSSEAMHTDWHNLSVIFQYERNDFKNAQQGYLQALELLEKCELTKAHPEKYHEARYKTWRNLSIVCHALQDHAGFSKWVMLIAANYSRKAKRDTFFMYH
jgi:tetratricopeptide (TPR) repeat protein